MDALMIAGSAHIHAAAPHTRTTFVTAGNIFLDTDQCNFAEQAVDCTKRTEKAAEAPVTENTDQPDEEHDNEFSDEQDTQHSEIICVVGMGEQSHGTFQRAGGTDVFAEARYCHMIL